jgi:tetratricopeptide (TPR) repeat protein/predicted Ser/Thr protein kinase
MTGRTLAHYVVGEKLGAGGMGVVYRARDTRLEREVALKVVGEQAASEGARDHLLREARTASALNHPNICTIYDAAVAGEETYIAMELVEGRPLAGMIPAGGLAAETVIRYGAQIADALDHAHARGVVHRDLKSQNVIVTSEGRPKVLDFGLARRVSSGLDDSTRSMATVTAPGTIAGTLPFMAPEVLAGQPADARSDLWALGVMLHHMLTGSYPFWGETVFDISSAIQRDAPAPLPANTPAALANVVRRLLAKQPGERYQRAGEVRAALETIQSGVLEATPAPAVGSRRWVLAAAGIVAIGAPLGWLALRSRAPGVPADNRPRLSDGAWASSNAEANAYYEQATQLMGKSPRHDPLRSRTLMEKALAIDPKFAAARAALGFGQMILIVQGDSNDSSWIYKAEETARAALRDDPECGTAHAVLAGTAFLLGRKERVPEEARKALQANPKDMPSLLWFPIYDRINGDYDKAIAELRRLVNLAPTFWPARVNLAEALVEVGDSVEAVQAAQRVLDADPESRIALAALARAYLNAGDLALARRTLERASPEQRKNFRLRLHWALLLAREGRREEALKEMDAGLLAFAGIGQYWPLWATEFYAVMGEPDKALEWLDRAVRNGDDRAPYWRRSPHLTGLRGNPRFQQMIDAAEYRRQQRAAGR